ncbi:MAG: hypothetical protein II453_05455 [Alphaproteobacteria bacterium]|nr:hypothetical protein [Alphaproteobacteria bacterium]
MENGFNKNIEEWNGRIRSMLRRSMAAMCEEESPELREEIMKDYEALCAAEIAMEKLYNTNEKS